MCKHPWIILMGISTVITWMAMWAINRFLDTMTEIVMDSTKETK